jgi:nickel-dependent lactate racemase
VPDATRYAALEDVLPAVLDRVLAAGVPAHATTVVVAAGTHPPMTSAALEALLGPLPPGVRAIQHRSREHSDLVSVGELGSGHRVRLHRSVVEAALLVTVGTVRHHYFAGFGGGGKLVFPGVAGYEEIQVNHSRVLTPDGTDGMRPHPGCEPGILNGNPVAEEIAKAVELHPPHFSLCLIPGNDGRIARAIGGEWRAAFDAAVAQVRDWYEVSSVPKSRLAVASAGGDPSDATLIQAHKALDAACRFVEPDGELLFFADLGGGAGSPEMEPFLEDPRPESILRRLGEGWVQYGHTTLRIVEKTSRFRVQLVSRLDMDVARRLGFIPVDDPAEVVRTWREREAGASVTVLPGQPLYPARNPV